MLGAGSLVASGKRLEGGYLWLGAPARRIRPLTDKELDYICYSAEHYQRLAHRHRTTTRSLCSRRVLHQSYIDEVLIAGNRFSDSVSGKDWATD